MRNLLIPKKSRSLVSYNFSTGTTADWTAFGGTSTISVSGGSMVIGGTGNVNFQEGYYLNTYVSRLERVRLKGTYTCTVTKAGATYGLGIGFQSINTIAASKASLAANLDYSTSASTGSIFLRRIQNTTFTNLLAAQTGSISFAANDVINFEIEMFQNNMTVDYFNVTQNQSIKCSYQYIVNASTNAYNSPNTWCPAFYNVGSGGTVTALTLETEVPLNPDIAFVGDSLTRGFYTDTNDFNASRWVEKLVGPSGPYAGLSYAVMGGASDKTADVLLGITELTTLAPKNVILCIGTNDLGGSISSGTFQTNYASIVSQLVSAGCRVFPCLLWPRNDFDVNTSGWNPYLISTYATGTGLNGGKLILDSYWSLKALTSGTGQNTRFVTGPADGVHPVGYHQTYADIIYANTRNRLIL